MQDWPPPNYRPDYGTGYRLSLADFRRLLEDTEGAGRIARLLKTGIAVSRSAGGVEVRGADGAAVAIKDLHAQVQADPKMQYFVYQLAMDLWR